MHKYVLEHLELTKLRENDIKCSYKNSSWGLELSVM